MTTSSLVLLITLKVLHGLGSCYTVLWSLLTLLETWHKTTGFKEFLQFGVLVLWNNLPEEIWLGTLHLINLIIYNPLIIFATELMFCNVHALKITHSLFIYFFMYCRYPHAPLASTVHSTHYQHSKKNTQVFGFDTGQCDWSELNSSPVLHPLRITASQQASSSSQDE